MLGNIYNYWPRYNRMIDFFYAKWLRLFGRKNILQHDDLEKIKHISLMAYGEDADCYRGVNTVAEFVNGIGCDAAQLDFNVEDGFYWLCIEHYNCIELYDLASETCRYVNITKVIAEFFKRYNKKIIYCKSRATTSYPILKLYEKRGKIEIPTDMVRTSFGEEYHLMTVRSKIKV